VSAVGTGPHSEPASAACVRLLGAVRFVSDAGETVDLPSAGQRRLVALLALAAGATLRPDSLSEQLELSPGGLRTAVSRLRTRLGESVIATDAVGYRLTCAVDAVRFTQLLLEDSGLADRLGAIDQALSLWDGDALDEFRHEPWAEAEAARLDELRCVAIEERAELLISRGRGGEAVAVLEAHIATNPWRDRPRGLHLQALATEGRQADALRAYQDYRTFLIEETGTEPSALVQSIERRVAAGWTGGAGTEALGSDSAPTPERAAAAPFIVPLPGVLAQGPTLIGRRRELTWLESELVQARAGALRMVLLSGEAGIGKTTLLASLARAQVGAGGTLVYGRCDDGAAVPLQPFRDVVGALVDAAPADLLRTHCERHGGELARVAPRLLHRVGAPPPQRSDDATGRYLLFEAVTDLLRQLAASGAPVLILDDLHWAEPTALLLVRHLARALVGVPMLIVASFRDTDEPSAELLDALADLERLGARRIALEGFDDAELADLVLAVTESATRPGAEVLAQLREQTAGNPLYAEQLVRHLFESGGLVIDDGVRLSGGFTATALPTSLVDVVSSRVRALGGDTHEVLQASAVLGVEFDEEVLIEMMDRGDREIASALDASVAAGLLVETGASPPSLRFTHALVAHALTSEVGGSQRRRLHERAARALQKREDDLPQKVVVELARHWALAGDRAAAMRWATEAGNYALANFAPSEAAIWFETALDHSTALHRPESERGELLVRLGEARQRAGDARARATLLEAGALARRSGDADVLIRAALATDRGLGRVGSVDVEQLEMTEAAIEMANVADTTTYARLLALYARELIHTPRFELRQQISRRAVEMIDASDDPTLLPLTMSALTFALEGPGTVPLRRDLALRAVALARAGDDPFVEFWTSRAAYFVAIESADPDLARDSLEHLTAIATNVGEPRLLWIAKIYETFAAMMEGRLDDAERSSAAELDIGLEIGEPDAFSMYAGQLFMNRSFAGRYDELLSLTQGIVDGDDDMLAFHLAHAIVCAATGRIDDARAVLDQGAQDGFSQIPLDYLWVTTVIGYAVLTIELEDTTLAAQLFAMLEPIGDEVAFSGATSQGPISAYLGKLASLMGRHDAADTYLQQALETARSFGWKYHEATTLVALARSRQRRTGSLDDDSNAWLDAAEAIATDRGLLGVTAQIAAART
jgi:DNA-binding SARP family transcriptional activator/tetratricopeptide (TPR) repeat protein